MRARLKRLAEQVVVITGASSGIGLATARKAARAGAKVVLVSRNGAALDRICRQIRDEGGTADFAVADVGDQAQVWAAAERAIALHGGFDTWVNVAGVAIYAPLARTPRDEHERLFRTNYWGVVNGCLAALDHLRSRGGAIVTVGSIVSDIGAPILGAYAASKHAAKGFVDSLRMELLADRVPVSLSLIKPAGIGTPMRDHAANHMPGRPQIPPPAYTPDLVADAILHAAQTPRREITVGGIGRQQALFTAMLPSLGDRLAVALVPLLNDRRQADRPGDNLFGPGAGAGLERSRDTPSLPFSAYNLVEQHPRAATVAGLAGLALGLYGWTRRRA